MTVDRKYCTVSKETRQHLWRLFVIFAAEPERQRVPTKIRERSATMRGDGAKTKYVVIYVVIYVVVYVVIYWSSSWSSYL